MRRRELRDKKGDYVLATKYADGHPGDGHCVGFYDGSYNHYGIEIRHLVIDSEGKQFHRNGFRRVEKISAARGNWLVGHMRTIEKFMRAGNRRSVWGWARLPMKNYPVTIL